MHRLHLTAEEMARQHQNNLSHDSHRQELERQEERQRSGGRPRAPHEEAADRQGLDAEPRGAGKVSVSSGRLEMSHEIRMPRGNTCPWYQCSQPPYHSDAHCVELEAGIHKQQVFLIVSGQLGGG